MTRARHLTLAAVALAAGLSLTACQGSDDSAASTNDSGSSSSASSASSSSTSTSSSSASGGSSTSGANATGTSGSTAPTDPAPGSGGGQVTTGLCKTADLEFGLAHGMAEGEIVVSFKNTGGDACSLKGFPGVDLKSPGSSDALSAGRSKLAAPAVAVRPGEATRFTLHYPPNNSGGSGLAVNALVVTPPGETHSKTLPVSFSLPVSTDATGGVTVDPVGTGKQ
ncbi:DUF4232 domain-containing protein [Streptomyces sp. NBC_00820]|uniref:DUF4232 domain-containing protein n=1 Tax=Streptomyces sp. NBC_00820 TaxID=2975842 RepID=UPI002ED03300|nr:DUF4232 domain-containing protein [Streptomyces sp. NBC_00820]